MYYDPTLMNRIEKLKQMILINKPILNNFYSLTSWIPSKKDLEIVGRAIANIEIEKDMILKELTEIGNAVKDCVAITPLGQGHIDKAKKRIEKQEIETLKGDGE